MSSSGRKLALFKEFFFPFHIHSSLQHGMNLEKTEVMWIGEQEEVVRKYRGECKQEQQRGGEWKALCGTEN